jgi:hypothetical protein
MRLRTRRAELCARESDLPRRKCQLCHETWPLTGEFFPNAGNSAKYFVNTGRMCYSSPKGGQQRGKRRVRHE